MKQEYISMRNKNQFDINWFYKYFLENGGTRIDLNSFSNLFALQRIETIVDYLDSKFELTRLYDKEGNLIKIVE